MAGIATSAVYAVQRARAEAFTLGRDWRCDSCGEERRCARLEPLAVDEHWFCEPCWDYQLGRAHGRRQAIQDLRALVDAFSVSLR